MTSATIRLCMYLEVCGMERTSPTFTNCSWGRSPSSTTAQVSQLSTLISRTQHQTLRKFLFPDRVQPPRSVWRPAACACSCSHGQGTVDLDRIVSCNSPYNDVQWHRPRRICCLLLSIPSPRSALHLQHTNIIVGMGCTVERSHEYGLAAAE